MPVGFVLALSALLVASPVAAPVAADVRVMCYGDAITAGTDETNPANSYPGELQRLRPDFAVVNEGRDGDVSGNLARFRAALAEWPPDVVVLLLGTNDPVCAPNATPGCDDSPTPDEAAANVLGMAAEARNAGAKVLVVTPPPAVCKAHCDSQNEVAYAMWMRDAFTGRLADALRRVRTPRGIRIADLRRRMSDAAWSTLSSDGLHPSEEGNRMIARFVAAHIGGGTRRTATAPPTTGRAAAEPPHLAARRGMDVDPDPFVRRPEASRSPRRTYSRR